MTDRLSAGEHGYIGQIVGARREGETVVVEVSAPIHQINAATLGARILMIPCEPDATDVNPVLDVLADLDPRTLRAAAAIGEERQRRIEREAVIR